MRFSAAWAATAAQNVTLKAAIASLSIVSIALAITTARLSVKKPLLIERGCFSRTVASNTTAHSIAEIETFIREAIEQRFNSDATPMAGYLAANEETARTREQKELTQRGMTQVIIVRSVKVTDNTAVVETDRVISVEQIRSALRLTLNVTIATTARSESNPYGLQLIKVEQPKQEVKP